MDSTSPSSALRCMIQFKDKHRSGTVVVFRKGEANMSVASRTIQGVCLLCFGVLLGRWVVPVTTVSAQASAANAGEIMFGTVPVRLGMKKDVVLGTLHQRY